MSTPIPISKVSAASKTSQASKASKALTLKEQAYHCVRRMILEGELKPGEWLTERILVERLGMSRTPIRAALERLDADGLAVYTPNKGLTVVQLSLQKAAELYDYRMAVECFVVRRLSLMTLSEEQLQGFADNLHRQAALVAQGDDVGFTEADTQFHRKLADVYGNVEISRTMEQLQDKLNLIALQVLRKDRSRITVSHQDHVRLFEHIRDGRAAEAAQAMEEHLDFGKRILLF